MISTVATQSLHLQEHIQEHGLNKKTQCQLDRVHKFVHAHRGVLSAIRRIPPELLQEIFIHTTVGANRWDSIPWALCLVCRSWRIAALSVSSLWNRLPPMYLRCPRMPGSVSSVLAEIRELLVRSRDAPITFYIYAPLRNLCLDSDSIINVLASHSERWQTVSIDSAYLSLFSCKRVKGRLSSLRTLSIHISGAANFADMYEDAPQLREVCLSGIFSQELRLPFSQLTHYKECISGRGMAGHVISLAKSLTTLHLARCYGSADIPVSTLPVLVTLMVEGYEIRSQGFLDNLTLPAIQEIWIAGFRGHLITILTAMIYRSHSPCMLKKLAFRTSEVDSGELTKLLKLTPHLVDLNLPLPPQEDLTNLIIRRNSQPLVPLLQMLTFEPDGMTRTHSQSLNALAVSRSNLQDGLMSRDCRALHELRIVFQPPRVSHSELRFLEDWHESEGSKQLGIWKQGLIQEFPELGDRYRIEQRTLDSGWRDRIFDILSDIKKFKVKNVNDIYVCYEFHVYLIELMIVLIDFRHSYNITTFHGPTARQICSITIRRQGS